MNEWPHSFRAGVSIEIDGVSGTWTVSRKHLRPLDAVELIAELA